METYWCSRCGRIVGPNAKSCPKCNVVFAGVREGTESDRASASRRYAIGEFQSTSDMFIYFLDEHWLLLLSLTYGPLLLSCYWLWNCCSAILLLATVVIALLTGIVAYYRLHGFLCSCVILPMYAKQSIVVDVLDDPVQIPLSKLPPDFPQIYEENNQLKYKKDKKCVKHHKPKPFFRVPFPEDEEINQVEEYVTIRPISKKTIESTVCLTRFPVLKTLAHKILCGSDATTDTVNYVSWRLFLFGGLFGLVVLPVYTLGLLGSYWICVLVAKII